MVGSELPFSRGVISIPPPPPLDSASTGIVVSGATSLPTLRSRHYLGRKQRVERLYEEPVPVSSTQIPRRTL